MILVPFYSLPPVLDETDSTMDKMVTAGLESQETNDGGDDGSSLIDTTIMLPMVQDLAFSASDKAQKRVLKKAAALKRDADTEFRNKFRCMQAEKRARELESTRVQLTKASVPKVVHNKDRPVLNVFPPISLLATVLMEDMPGFLNHVWMPKEEHW
jgi:hypothetical protein